MKKIGFIGIGNMGGAILSGYAQSGKTGHNQLLAFDMNRKKFHSLLSAKAADSCVRSRI